MRAVWSLWTKPLKSGYGNAWYSWAHYLLSWILSVGLASRHYHETSLWTDDLGAKILVDGLRLNFTSISTKLNDLEHQDAEWWALGKLYTYLHQVEPFVHIDNDVFLWKPLPRSITSSPVFGQNPEYLTESVWYLPQNFEDAILNLPNGWLPVEWFWYRALPIQNQRAVCCGIFGGNATEFIRYYADLPFRIVNHPHNRGVCRAMIDKIRHVPLLEQYLLSACCEYYQANLEPRFGDVHVEYLFKSFGEAHQRAEEIGFTHLIATAKKDLLIAKRLERRVMDSYPSEYERCMQYLGMRSSTARA